MKKILLVMIFCLLCGKVSAQENFKVEGIAEVFGDGEKISTAILEYQKALQKKYFSKKFFSRRQGN